MKKFIFIALLITIFISCGSSSKTVKKLPSHFKTESHISYPNGLYISAVGMDKNEAASKRKARANVAKKISSTLTATFTSNKKSLIVRNDKVFRQVVNEVIKENITFKYTNLIKVVETVKYSGNYYSFAVIKRSEGKNVVYPEMIAAKKLFEDQYGLALKSINQVEKKDFLELFKKVLVSGEEYSEKLLTYYFLDGNTIKYSEEAIFSKINDLKTKYLDTIINLEWVVYTFSNKNGVQQEDKKGSEILHKFLKERGNKVDLLTNYIDDPKKGLKYKDIKNLKSELDNENKILLEGEIIYDIYQQYKDVDMVFCKSKMKVRAILVKTKKEVFNFTIGTFKDDSTKVGRPMNKACKESLNVKLIKYIKKELPKFTKKYERN